MKPGFFKNPDLADAGPVAQLLFAGLWLLADKEGRLKDQPRVIKAEIFPYYDVDVNRELTVIERLGHIQRYVAHGVAVIEVQNFKKHQSPHHTERPSELPAREPQVIDNTGTRVNHRELTVSSPLENGGNPSDSLIPDSLIPDSLIHRKPAARAAKQSIPIPADFALTTAMADQARKKFPDADVDEMFTQFKAHHESHGKTMKSWPAAWVTWIGNASKFGYPKQRSTARKWE